MAEMSKVVQLPVWPEAVRTVPNAVLRSALFGAIRRRRRYMQGELIASVDGVRVLQTGPRLDQVDLDVWEKGEAMMCRYADDFVCAFQG